MNMQVSIDTLPSFNTLTIEQPEQGIYLLTINRPDVLNALNTELLTELSTALNLVKASEEARVLLLTGAGEKSFVAGADIAEMSKLNPMQGKAFSEQGIATFRQLEQLKIPTIALVNGYALGGGCELAMACDFMLASDNARLGQPEVSLGITPGFGGSQRLTRLVGRAMALELVLSGRHILAHEALQRGLVNHVYPQAELQDEGIKLAIKIRNNSRHAVQLSKELIQRGQDLDLDTANVMESGMFGLSFATPDQEEGMNAFLQRRKPDFLYS